MSIVVRDNETKKWASFAKAAYIDDKNEKENIVHKYAGNDYEYDNEYSGSKRDVWVNEEKKEVVVAFRGTRVSDIEDLGSDLAILVGHEVMNPRFRVAVAGMKKIIKDFKGYKIYLSSHSLGASINTLVENLYPNYIEKSYNFNPGSSIRSAITNLTDKITGKKRKACNNYIVKGDPISMIGTLPGGCENKIFKPIKGSSNPHTIDQFLT